MGFREDVLLIVKDCEYDSVRLLKWNGNIVLAKQQKYKSGRHGKPMHFKEEDILALMENIEHINIAMGDDWEPLESREDD